MNIAWHYWVLLYSATPNKARSCERCPAISITRKFSMSTANDEWLVWWESGSTFRGKSSQHFVKKKMVLCREHRRRRCDASSQQSANRRSQFCSCTAARLFDMLVPDNFRALQQLPALSLLHTLPFCFAFASRTTIFSRPISNEYSALI